MEQKLKAGNEIDEQGGYMYIRSTNCDKQAALRPFSLKNAIQILLNINCGYCVSKIAIYWTAVSNNI